MTLNQILELLQSLSLPDAVVAVVGIANSFIIEYFPGLKDARGKIKLGAMIGLSFGIPILAAVVKLALWQVNGIEAVDFAVAFNNLIAAAIAGLLAVFTGTGFYHLTFREDDNAKRADA